MLGMRSSLFGFAFILLSTSAMATSIVEPIPPVSIQSENAGETPQYIRNALQSSRYYEEVVMNLMNALRQSAGKDGVLTKQDVEFYQQRQEAQRRSHMIQTILMADFNNDGKVTYEEAQNYIGALNTVSSRTDYTDKQLEPWFKQDKNNDRILTYDEMRQNLEEQPKDSRKKPTDNAAELMLLDSNRDGSVTPDEVRSNAKKYFDLADADKNGILSPEEQQGLRQQQQQPQTPPVEKLLVDQDAELHAVGVYEGDTGEGKAAHGPEVKVAIDRLGKKVALLLQSHEPVRWMLTASKDTNVSQIYYTSRENAPSEVLLNGKLYEKAKKAPLQLSYQDTGIVFRRALDYIKAATGRDKVDGYAGAYRPTAEGLILKTVSENPELKVDRLVVVPSEKLPKLTFLANIDGKAGLYDLSGNLIKPVARELVDAAYVPSNKSYYALDGDDGLIHYDSEGKKLESIPISLDVPRMSWPSLPTYNQKTHEIVISSSLGAEHVHHYHLTKKKWSITPSKGARYNSIAYDEQTNSYAATSMNKVGMIQINNDGIKTENLITDLSKAPGYADLYDPNNGPPPTSKIIVTKEYYIIHVLEGFAPRESSNLKRAYLYDRKNHTLALTYAAPQPVNQNNY